jgi:5-methylcytosine-specific restriction endonuclease McrA
MDMKVCSKCKRELPASKEYFFADCHKKDGFDSACKECKGRKFGRYMYYEKALKGNRICTSCKRELPATLEYFNAAKKVKKDGLQSTCKECKGGTFGVKQLNKVYESVKGYKYCVKCKQQLPANEEYFFKGNGYLGLHDNCKKCEGHEYGIHAVNMVYKAKEGYNYCNMCHKELPATTDYFVSSKGKHKGLVSICKDCMKTDQFRKKSYIHLNRRKTRKQNCIATLTSDEFEECLAYFDFKDAYTGLPMEIISQDHVIPLSKGGGYVKQNIIPCEKSINSSKNNSDMETWYRQQPFFDEGRLQKIYDWIGMKDDVQQLSIL